jgi:hypothetical protein
MRGRRRWRKSSPSSRSWSLRPIRGRHLHLVHNNKVNKIIGRRVERIRTHSLTLITRRTVLNIFTKITSVGRSNCRTGLTSSIANPSTLKRNEELP